jgi:type II secretory pathway pseudopilin PulG
MRIGLIAVAVLALIGYAAIAYMLPSMENAKAKEAAQALMAGAETAKQQVAAIAQKAGDLAGSGKDVKATTRNDSGHGQLKWIVSESGAIRGWNDRNAIEIVLTPALQAGKITWTCKGYPHSAMPAGCGG